MTNSSVQHLYPVCRCQSRHGVIRQRELCTIGRVKQNPTLDAKLQTAQTAAILGVLIESNKNPVTPAEKCLTYGIHAAAGVYEGRVVEHYGKTSRTACRQRIFPNYGQPHYKLFSRIERHREYVEQCGILITTAEFFGNTMIDLPRSIHSRLLENFISVWNPTSVEGGCTRQWYPPHWKLLFCVLPPT